MVEREVNHDREDGGFGKALASYPDLDGDGYLELLVGAPATLRYRGDPGTVFLLSGKTGLILWQAQASSTGSLFGVDIAVGSDLDGDGFPEVYVMEPQARVGAPVAQVNVLSGATGQVDRIFALTSVLSGFRSPLISFEDLNGDGIRDLAYGDIYSNAGRGGVHFLSGADGLLIQSAAGTVQDRYMGYSLSKTMDADGDGIADLLVGIPLAGAANEGAVKFLSGLGGSLIQQYPGTVAGGEFGWAVASLPDLDGDGFPDFIAGAPYAAVAGFAGAGQATVVSGRAGTRLAILEGDMPGEGIGRSVFLAGDLDGDGFREILVGSWLPGGSASYSTGAVHVLHRSGGLLWTLEGGLATLGVGFDFADLGDLDGDGLDEMALGAPDSTRNGVARAGAVLFSGLQRLIEVDQDSVSASVGGLVNFRLDFPDDAAAHRYQLLGSMSGTGPLFWNGLRIPLSHDLMLDRMRAGSRLGVFNRTSGVLDSAGRADLFARVLPGHALSLVGRDLHFAAVSFLPPSQPSYSSVAARIVVLP